jgi:hypothetical protein
VVKWRQKRDREKAKAHALRHAGALRLRRSESGDSSVARDEDNDDEVIVEGLGRAMTTSVGRIVPAGSSLTRAESEKRAMSLARAVQGNDHAQLMPASQSRPNRSAARGHSSSSRKSSHGRSGSRGATSTQRPGASFVSLGSKQNREESVLAQIKRTVKHDKELELPKWSRSEVHMFFSQVRKT